MIDFIGEIKDAFFEQRLAVIDLATGKLRQLSPADTYVYEYDWAPDGLSFVASRAPEERSPGRWRS